jgi:hypothetical protein
MSEPAERAEGTTVVAPLDADERAELQRLRLEISNLRATQTRPVRQFRWKSFASGVLIVLSCVLFPLALVTVWVNNQVSNTDRFVANVEPLIHDSSVQAGITDRVTAEIFTYVDVQALANDAVNALAAQGLPPPIADRLRGLTGPLASSLRGFVHGKVAELVASPQFTAAWDQSVRIAHQQINNVLSGNSSAIGIEGDKVTLDLAVFISAAKQQLVADGLTIADRIPDVHPKIDLMDARSLVRAQNAYRILDNLATWLPWIVLVLLAAGVYVARDHRRALLNSGIGVAAGMLVLAAAVLIARGLVVNGVPNQAAAPAGASFDILVRFLRDGLRTLLVAGLVVALGAFVVGPSVTAVKIRASLSMFFAWLRHRGSKAGLRAGPVGAWVHANHRALQFGALALAVLTFVFIDRPSGLTVLLIAVLLLIVLGIIELLNQQPVVAPAGTGPPPGPDAE